MTKEELTAIQWKARKESAISPTCDESRSLLAHISEQEREIEALRAIPKTSFTPYASEHLAYVAGLEREIAALKNAVKTNLELSLSKQREIERLRKALQQICTSYSLGDALNVAGQTLGGKDA